MVCWCFWLALLFLGVGFFDLSFGYQKEGSDIGDTVQHIMPDNDQIQLKPVFGAGVSPGHMVTGFVLKGVGDMQVM